MSTCETILQRSMETTNTPQKERGTYQEYRRISKPYYPLTTDITAGEPGLPVFVVTNKVLKVTLVYNSVKEKRKKERMAFNRGE